MNEQTLIPDPLTPDPLSLDQALLQRSKAAQEIIDVDEPVIKLVIFELGGEWFAFLGEAIREILSQVEIFFVPGCPPSLEGVINVRGDIESVIRLSELLGKPVTEPAASSVILLGVGGGMHSGIRADRVVDVLDMAQSAIQPPPATLPEQLRRIVSGVTQYRNNPVVLLDLNRIFEEYQRGAG